MDNVIRNIVVDERYEAYAGYIPDGMIPEMYAVPRIKGYLVKLLDRLVTTWRATAITAQAPRVVTDVAHSTLEGYARSGAKDSSLIKFSDAVLIRLSREIDGFMEERPLREKIRQKLLVIADEIRALNEKPPLNEAPAILWSSFIRDHSFQMSLWATQRVCFVSVYNAYERFVAKCIQRASGNPGLRTSQAKEFKKAFRSAFDDVTLQACWLDPEIETFRLVRHALSHADGDATPELMGKLKRFRVEGEELHVFPENNKHQFAVLQQAVIRLMTAAVGIPSLVED